MRATSEVPAFSIMKKELLLSSIVSQEATVENSETHTLALGSSWMSPGI